MDRTETLQVADGVAGASFIRVEALYRYGEGGTFQGFEKLSRREISHWQSSTKDTIERILTVGEASISNLAELIEVARKSCLTPAEANIGENVGEIRFTRSVAEIEEIRFTEISSAAMPQPVVVAERKKAGHARRRNCCGSRPTS